MTTAVSTGEGTRRGAIEIPMGTSLDQVESLMIGKTLEAAGGDKNLAARLLGINLRTIYRWLKDQKSV